ncbi:MAG: hypothetical protein AB7S49_07435 [Arcobacter sp.]|jgi:hypothetical protein|uniref:Uncharacterized protein n=1 Tax=Arcobacter defluvii TaxID=873191 RepID=A0AAE7BHZ9_9BACT|nr:MULTISPECIES: hypothetical protein [Arcobacter]QKF78342.1 hypothetical protein ADFLV_2337 [Arcobacter defluvii]RXI30208.1 hypothetical protein CP964_12280 [Arcobacter defluvii]BAK74139.1 conserved hypothetical protein [Arcobacter sp. L]
MLEKNLIGFSQKEEYLPKDFDEFNSVNRLRQLFLNLSNNILDSYCHFSKYEQRKLSNYQLESAFSYKIKNLLPTSFIKVQNKNNRHFKFCINSTKIINNYLNPNKKTSLFISNKQLLPIAKLISICFTNNNLQLLIDKHLLFHEFVLKKIKKLHIDKTVIDLGDSICIKSKDFVGLKIYTSWKDIEVKKPNIKDELKGAIKSIKKGEYFQIYLAYPKNNEFTKQIPVYVDELKNEEYQIKAIPYSLRSIIKNN